MKITANRTIDDVTEQDKIDEQVFKNAYIPRTLDAVIDFERDFYKAKEGDTEEFLYSKISGLKTDLSGPQHVPTLLKESKTSSSSQQKNNDNKLESEEGGYSQGENDDDDISDGEEMSNDTDSSSEEEEGTNKNKGTAIRPRDESPNSKKERKRLVKDAQKEKRQNKMPKHVKKRKEKLAKQGKKKSMEVLEVFL
ncbi:serine/threonine-protein kinase RIO1-like [Mercenaria mercenaria]|uniref:serine/threonine-protein kinase RIO1-like n=1 Tax=Mercenaria mercenaria TaxID=6596 RepID=UPI00234E83BE|nr:serine/threonine-protein kinase RIO1-like [Mercenaria mercenaria]